MDFLAFILLSLAGDPFRYVSGNSYNSYLKASLQYLNSKLYVLKLPYVLVNRAFMFFVHQTIRWTGVLLSLRVTVS